VIGRHESEIVRTVGFFLAPFIMLFGLYVIAHGHYGPGGGFAGGVILAVGVVLIRITADEETGRRHFPAVMGPLVMSAGMLGFVLAGLIPTVAGGAFLDYAHIEVAGVAASRLRYLGILVVEVAIGLAVFGALLWLFDLLAERREA
jgi:multicomponent Na+:H+ antiporter subunit B